MSKISKDYYNLISYLVDSVSKTVNNHIEQQIDWNKIINKKDLLISISFGIKSIADAAKSIIKLFNKDRKTNERFFKYSKDGKQFTVNEEIFVKYVNQRMPVAYLNIAIFFFMVAAGESGNSIKRETFHKLKQLAIESDFNNQLKKVFNTMIIDTNGNISVLFPKEN